MSLCLFVHFDLPDTEPWVIGQSIALESWVMDPLEEAGCKLLDHFHSDWDEATYSLASDVQAELIRAAAVFSELEDEEFDGPGGMDEFMEDFAQLQQAVEWAIANHGRVALVVS